MIFLKIYCNSQHKIFFRHEPADYLRAIKDILEVFENANNSILDIYKTNEVSITSIKVKDFRILKSYSV